MNRQTFEFLRWKVTAARAAARRTMLDSLERRARRAAAAPVTRWFRSADREPWSVTESTIRYDASEVRSCLVFASDGAVRRVWDYPGNWREMTDAELEELSWRR